MEEVATQENIKLIRDVVGRNASEMDILQSLHTAQNNVERALNVLLDNLESQQRSKSLTNVLTKDENSTAPKVENIPEKDTSANAPHSGKLCQSGLVDSSMNAMPSTSIMEWPQERAVIDVDSDSSETKFSQLQRAPPRYVKHTSLPSFSSTSSGSGRITAQNFESWPNQTAEEISLKCRQQIQEFPLDHEWILLDVADVEGFSTCKGSKLTFGDRLYFTYPKPDHLDKSMRNMKRPWGRGKLSSEIVRFSTVQGGEVGRLPADWARCLIPLVHSGLVKAEGVCKSAPSCLSLIDSIVLSIGFFINRAFFRRYRVLRTTSLPEGTANHMVPMLLLKLGMKPFRKADFCPEYLYSQSSVINSRPSGFQDTSSATKRLKADSDTQSAREHQEEESVLSDSEVTNFVGISDSRELEEMEPPGHLECELRPYQKQALFWMSNLEAGKTFQDAANSLHPCWAGYHLADMRASAFYINLFSGEATLDFPSALQESKGGILADAMGLGKTVMTIALILTNRGRGSLSAENVMTKKENFDGSLQCSSQDPRKFSSSQLSNKESSKSAAPLCNKMLWKGGGTLIVCPMTLLGQWKTEFESHVSMGVLSVYAHYNPGRSKDPRYLLKHDIVLTTYGIVQSEYDASNSSVGGPLHSVHWFRIVLDEAHTIKASKSSTAQAVFNLQADRRWCLTGTPVQNKLEDIFSLFHFLRVEPWSNWGWWNKMIQKPYEEETQQGLKLLQSILKPLMLRRTKDSTDSEGRPILVLPPTETQVIYCELSEAERDFYDALFHKSKVKFDKFVEQGRVLHNYASILVLLLRLRQCCGHPFLVLSRGDTRDDATLEKFAKRFLNRGHCDGDAPSVQGPSKAYVQEVVDDLRKGEKAECPICLEAVEDAVFTPCAHCMCRECLFASWRNSGSGSCPLCRHTFNKQDIVAAPTNSRFRVDVQKNWTESSKVTSLLQRLEGLKNSGAKSVVFSQWTSFLDLLEIPLKRKKLKYNRLDGNLSQQRRESVIKEFSNNPDVLVLLISLKAGGVGLNLTAASSVFLLDPWWNPAVEEQAIMRIHRMGQTKKVSIYRFIIKDSVEEKMLQVQARKQNMIAGALTDEEVRTTRIEELKMLFR